LSLATSALADLTVTYFSVGQGDAALIQCDDEAMLVDAGTNASAQRLLQYLTDLNVTNLKYAVGTHPHEDHVGGLDAVINTIPVINVLMPDAVAETKTFDDVLSAVERHNLEITVPAVGEQYTLGESTFTILAPERNGYGDLNNHSIVFRLDYGDTSFLFTGDAELESETEMLGSGGSDGTGLPLKADVLKVGHHGSSTSTSQGFLDAVSPRYAVISCGKDNSYGHPTSTVLRRLQDAGVTVYRTDVDGTVILSSDGTNIFNGRIVEGEAETGNAGTVNAGTVNADSYGVTAVGAVNVRERPVANAKVVTTIAVSGTPLTILKTVVVKDVMWYAVALEGLGLVDDATAAAYNNVGYIRSDLVTVVDEATYAAAVLRINATPTPKPTPKPTVKPTAKPTVKATTRPTAKPTTKPKVTATPKPSDNQSSMVWLSATGSKYHRIPNCGRMNPSRARQVSLETAKRQGYGACKNCRPPQ
jgi:competence protein ComEC